MNDLIKLHSPTTKDCNSGQASPATKAMAPAMKHRNEKTNNGGSSRRLFRCAAACSAWIGVISLREICTRSSKAFIASSPRRLRVIRTAKPQRARPAIKSTAAGRMWIIGFVEEIRVEATPTHTVTPPPFNMITSRPACSAVFYEECLETL